MKAEAVLDKFVKSDPTRYEINTDWCTTKSTQNNIKITMSATELII